MESQITFLYRGTTRDWPGNPMLQRLKCTPTTEDPVCATLFGLNAARFGEGIVYLCEWNRVADLIRPGNIFAETEREVVIGVTPREFAEQLCVRWMPVQAARDVLAELGFELPAGVPNNAVLDQLLRDTPRLSRRHVEMFNELATKRGRA